MIDFWKKRGPGLVLLAGMAAITLGAGMIFFPAGFIVGGALGIAWWVLDSIGGDGH